MARYGYRMIEETYYKVFPNEVDVTLQVGGSEFTFLKMLHYLIDGYFTDLGKYGESIWAEEDANGWTDALQTEYHRLKNATARLVRNYMNPQLWAYAISYLYANNYVDIGDSTIDLQEIAVKLADMILEIVFELYETEAGA